MTPFPAGSERRHREEGLGKAKGTGKLDHAGRPAVLSPQPAELALQRPSWLPQAGSIGRVHWRAGLRNSGMPVQPGIRQH